MKHSIRFVLVLLFSGIFSFAKGQDSLRFFHEDSLKAIVSFLAADSLEGRQNFTPSLEKAALYISAQFRNAGLEFYENSPTYFQPFIPQGFKVKHKENVTLNEKFLEPSNYFFYSSFSIVPNIDAEEFKIIASKALKAEDLVSAINKQLDSVTTPLLVIIPSENKSWIKSFKTKQFNKPAHSLLIVVSDELNPSAYVNVSGEARSKMLFNVIGVQKGKTRPDEIVLITAHYDHIGMNSFGSNKVYNGANDNASGTAAMLSMAKYFAELNKNERTIVFVAFAGEELGLVGSQHFASTINPKSVVAMFNLEMLGKEDPSGKRSLIITGGEHSNLDRIMSKYCKTIKINVDINFEEKLYTRSDNYPLAQKKVVAHTFMCFTPLDKDYHETTDEIETLDFDNFSNLASGLIPGIEAVVSGKETPKRR